LRQAPEGVHEPFRVPPRDPILHGLGPFPPLADIQQAGPLQPLIKRSEEEEEGEAPSKRDFVGKLRHKEEEAQAKIVYIVLDLFVVRRVEDMQFYGF
jgi:hypothetical protein